MRLRITIKMIITMIMIIITRINGERRNRIKSTVRLACGESPLVMKPFQKRTMAIFVLV